MMLRSMTGYGRAEVSSYIGQIVVEIQSVNRKFLEVSLYSLKELSRFDAEIRQMVMKDVFRGQISLRIHLRPDEKSLEANAALLQSLKRKWEKIARKLSLGPSEITLQFLVDQSKDLSAVDTFKDLEPLKKDLSNVVGQALKKLIQMKEKEGKALKIDLEKRLSFIEKKVLLIEKQAPVQLKNYETRLQEKISRYIQEEGEAKERLAKEVALFADKSDISEEIVRLRSHIQQFQDLLVDKDVVKGRKMDFLVQEMFREANTLSSKSTDSKIVTLSIDLRSEIDKIREQVQNIE